MKLYVRYAFLSVFLVLFITVLFNMNFWMQLPVSDAAAKRYKKGPHSADHKDHNEPVPDIPDPDAVYLFRNIKMLTRAEIRKVIDKMSDNMDTIESEEMDQLNRIKDTWFSDDNALSYQNPCWKNDRQVDCFPYAILGGFPKCGTTDLMTTLLSHPVVLKGTKKSTDWWTHGRFNNTDISEYADNFRDAASRVATSVNSEGSHNKVILDGSSDTIWDNSGIFTTLADQDYQDPDYLNLHVLKKFLPQTKFVLITRNPAHRLYADYLETHSNGTKEEFHRLVIRSLNLFQDCLRNPHATFLYCMYSHNSRHAPRIYPRILLGLYSVHVTILQTIFSPEQVLVTQLEDYKNNRTHALGQVTKFLEIPSYTPRAMKELVSRDKTMFDAKYAYLAEGRMEYMTFDTLDQFYKPFNKQLEDIINEQNARFHFTKS